MREASEEELDIAAYGEVEFLEHIEGASVILVVRSSDFPEIP